jgi:hypothetical protein
LFFLCQGICSHRNMLASHHNSLKHFYLSPNCRGIIHLFISHSFTHI